MPDAQCGDSGSHREVRLTSVSPRFEIRSLVTEFRRLSETLILLRWYGGFLHSRLQPSTVCFIYYAEWLVRVMDILRDLCSVKQGCIVCRFVRGCTLPLLLHPFFSSVAPNWIISSFKSRIWLSNYFNFKQSPQFSQILLNLLRPVTTDKEAEL